MEENVKVVEETKAVKKVDKKKKKAKKDKKKNDKFINPYKTTWGKILIIVLCASMALGTLASLIYLIIKNFILTV